MGLQRRRHQQEHMEQLKRIESYGKQEANCRATCLHLWP